MKFFNHRAKNSLCITDKRHKCRNYTGNFLFIYIQLNKLSLKFLILEATGNSVIKSGTYRKNQVAFTQNLPVDMSILVPPLPPFYDKRREKAVETRRAVYLHNSA